MAENLTANDTPASRRKLLIALLLGIMLLAIAWFTYGASRTAVAPARSTTESRPNSTQNVPPSSNGSVTQDGEETTDTTPSSSGTGANNYLSEDQNGTGVQ